MKNTQIIVGLVVVAVLVVGGAWWVRRAPVADTDSTTTTGAPEQTLRELLASKDPVECAISQSIQETKTDGTVYVAGGILRGDFISTVGAQGGQKVDSHIVIQDNRVYIWSSMSKQGFTAPVVKQEAKAASDGQGVDLDKKLAYSCKPWIVDQVKLVKPADVKFMSLEDIKAGGTVQ